MSLPTEKHQPATDGLLYRKIVLAGVQKIGKTTTGMGFTAKPLIIDTEGSAEGYECYREAVPNWQTFRRVTDDLAAGGHDFTGLVVDTGDELARHCQEYVIGALAGRDNDIEAGEYVHPSDFEYGKGWGAVSEEFRLRVGKLCSLGLPVLFVCHEKEITIKGRSGERTVFVPDVGNRGMRDWLLGYVDAILRATIVQTTEGDRHAILAAPSSDSLVGTRTPEGVKPPPPRFALSGAALVAALSRPKNLQAASTQHPPAQEQEKPAGGEQLAQDFRKPSGGRSRSGAKAA